MPPEPSQKSKYFIFAAILIIVIGFVVINYYSNSDSNKEAEYPKVEWDQEETGKIYNSGIRGTVTVGPTCPVERVPPDPSCADKKYQGEFIVKNVAGTKELARFSTDKNGYFSVNLNPGEYSIEPVEQIGLGVQAHHAEVKANNYTDLNLQFDTGIR